MQLSYESLGLSFGLGGLWGAMGGYGGLWGTLLPLHSSPPRPQSMLPPSAEAAELVSTLLYRLRGDWRAGAPNRMKLGAHSVTMFSDLSPCPRSLNFGYWLQMQLASHLLSLHVTHDT